MQERTYAIAVFVVLAICCLGMYVAVSSFLNNNPSAVSALTTPILLTTQVAVTFPTDTPAPTRPAIPVSIVPTTAPIPSPLGVFQTLTAAATIIFPTPVPIATRPPASPTSGQQSLSASCAGFSFCPQGGPPDFNLGIGGDSCPRNYIWGRVVGADGRGLRDRRIRFKDPQGEVNAVTSKGAPDPEGIYNIPTGQPGGAWAVWLLDPSGAEASPRMNIITQAYQGVGNCPTRIDFVQQR